MRFRSKDELGNDWSPYAYNKGDKSNSAPNVVKKERPFSNFDFALMTRAEIDFLEKLANGKNPYPKSALKEYGQSVRGYKQDSNQWEFVQLFRPEVLQNSLNWAPLNEELVNGGSISGQQKEYDDFYQALFPIDKEEKYEGQRPDQFVLNWYRFNRKGPFSTPLGQQTNPDNLIVGNLDKFITAGVDPNLKPDHPFYGRIIPPRELVYYIRRKYGISSAPDQTNEGNRSEFKPYYNQFLFQNDFSVEANAYWIGSNLKNKVFKDRIKDTNIPAAIKSANGGRTLSEQAFITRSMQWELFKKPDNFGISVLNDRTQLELGWFLNELYNSINTQKLFAHRRSISMLNELHTWGGALDRGLKSGNIIPVFAEVTKKGEESKILSDQDHIFLQRKMNVSVLASKNPEYNKVKIIQYISNIPEDVSKKRNIPDYKYHVRPWNREVGTFRTSGVGGPLFISPEYSSDFSSGECLDDKSRYFMRNLVRPLIDDFVNPSKYSESSDKNEESVYLTISEMEKRISKELPFLETALSNRDYNALKNITKNINQTGSQITGTGVESIARENIEKYLKESGIDYKIYGVKKNATSSIYVSIFSLGFVHYLFEKIKKLDESSRIFNIAKLLGTERFAKFNIIQHTLGHYAHSIHVFEEFAEPLLVGFKVVAALANVSLYKDTASVIGLTKEVTLGLLALENVYKTTIARALFPGLTKAGASLFWVAIMIGIGLWVDEIVSNVRQKDKQEKFRKLLEEAHKLGYIEGVYAETGGEIRISKKETKNIRLSETQSPEKIGNDISYENSFIISKEELMGPKGHRIFWDRISKNSIECETLLDIAGKPKTVIGQLTQGRYNSLLNMAPTQKDYGVFTDDSRYNVDGGINVIIPGSRNKSSSDKKFPYINAPLCNQYKVSPNFKYTREIIQYDTNLIDYLNGFKQSSEFQIIGASPLGGSIVKYSQKPVLEGKPPTDKEKVWLIRKKYGLDLINPEAGNNCCNTRKPINSATVSDTQNFPSDNIRLDSQKQFLTGEPNQVAIVGTDGKVKNELRYKVGCEYLVDLADPDVINKLREICSKKEEIPKDDKTSGKKTSKSPSGKNNTPVLSYNDQLNNEVQNMNLVNYLTQMGTSNQQLYREKGGDGATAGTNDQLPSLMGSPRFGQKASVEVFAQNQSSAPTTGVSQWLVGFATMDIHADLVNFINTLATAFATSYDGNPVPSNRIDVAALGTQIGSSNYFQWTPYGELPTETESARTMDGTFGTPNQTPPRTRG